MKPKPDRNMTSVHGPQAAIGAAEIAKEANTSIINPLATFEYERKTSHSSAVPQNYIDIR